MSEQDPLSFEVFKPVGPDELGRRKVHPLTPLIQAVRWWPAVLLAAVALPVLAARLRRTQAERYAGLRSLARD